jgi:hypothetical protein
MGGKNAKIYDFARKILMLKVLLITTTFSYDISIMRNILITRTGFRGKFSAKQKNKNLIANYAIVAWEVLKSYSISISIGFN